MNNFSKIALLLILIFLRSNNNIYAIDLPKINPEFNKDCYEYSATISNKSYKSNIFYKLNISVNFKDKSNKLDFNTNKIIATQ